jgi:predicted nucleic acid-binding protein
MIVTDASVWVSHLTSQEINHTISRRWLAQIINNKISIVAPGLLLSEVGGAIARRTSDPKIGRQAVNHILATPNIRLVYSDPALSLLAAKLATGRRLRGADSIYVAVAYQLNIPLVSWDMEHINRVVGIISSYTPADNK